MGQTMESEITRLLQAWCAGDGTALDLLMPRIYEELRRTARRYMRRQRAGHTLQTTALVNEVYLRLVNVRDVGCQHRAQFFALASQIMRRILVDAARARASAKRGGTARRADHSSGFDLDQIPDASSVRDRELVAINDALDVLMKMDPRKGRLVELRFFGGLSVQEAAEILEVSPQTVMRDWRLAKAWLMREVAGLSST